MLSSSLTPPPSRPAPPPLPLINSSVSSGEGERGKKKASVNLCFSPHEGKSDGKAEAVAAGNGSDARLRRQCGNNRVHVELWNAAPSSRLSAVAVSERDHPFLFPNYRK